MLSLLRLSYKCSGEFPPEGFLTRWTPRIKYYLVILTSFLLVLVPVILLVLIGWIFGFLRYILSLFLRHRLKEPIRFLPGMDALCAQESLSNHTVINGLIFLEGNPDVEYMRRLIQERILNARDSGGRLRYPQLRYYLHDQFGYFMWRSAIPFQIEDHVYMLPMKPIENDKEMKQFLCQMSNEPIPKGKPCWQVILLPLAENYEDFGSEPHFCCFMRFHHGLADGVSLVRLITAHMVDYSPELMQRLLVPSPERRRALEDVWNAARVVLLTPKALLHQVLRADINPLTEKSLTGRKFVSFSRPLNLAAVKQVKNATGATCNDVIMACICGALRRHFKSIQCDPPATAALIPLSLQRPHDPIVLGNNLTFVACDLPTNLTSPIRRLRTIAENMTNVKSSPDIWYNYFGFNFLVNRIPNFLTQIYFNSLRYTCIVSSVPGPPMPVTLFGGKSCKKAIFFLPHRGKLGLGVSIFTYNGCIYIGMNADASVIGSQDEIEQLQENFFQEFQDLEAHVKQMRGVNGH